MDADMMTHDQGAEAPTLSPDVVAKLDPAEIAARMTKSISRDLATSYNTSVLAFICQMLTVRDPAFAGHLAMFGKAWVEQIQSQATERSKAFAHSDVVSRHLPEEAQRKMALAFVTAHADTASRVVDQFSRVATPPNFQPAPQGR